MTQRTKVFVLKNHFLAKQKSEVRCRICKTVLNFNDEVCSNGSQHKHYYCISCAVKVNIL